MKHPKYAEDYAVCLRNLSVLITPGITHQNMLRLSRYDRQIVASLAEQVQQRRLALTHSQYDLLKNLVKKYSKQLKNHNVDAELINSMPLLMPLRQVDKTRCVEKVNKHLHLKFPFDNKLVEALRGLARGNGMFDWMPHQRLWKIAITEPNIEKVYEFATKHEVEISPEVKELYDSIQQYRQRHSNYKIILRENGVIENAAPSLLEYLEQVNAHSLLALADKSRVCGYAVDKPVWEKIRSQYDANIVDYYIRLASQDAMSSSMKVSEAVDIAFTYCKEVNRWPLVLINKDSNKPLDTKYNVINIAQQLNSYENCVIEISDYFKVRTSSQFVDITHNPNSLVIIKGIGLVKSIYKKVWDIS